MGKLDQLDKKTEEKGSGFVTIWQFVKFTFASLIAMISEFAILNIMNHIDAITNLNMQPFNWFVFHYKGDGVEGLGTMIAFLVSTTVAQIISFVVNRKKDLWFKHEPYFQRSSLFRCNCCAYLRTDLFCSPDKLYASGKCKYGL